MGGTRAPRVRGVPSRPALPMGPLPRQVVPAARGRLPGDMIQPTKPTVLVDDNNVMGSHPGGWWRKRAEAAPSMATASDRGNSGLTGLPVSARWARYRGSPPGSFAGGRRWPTHMRSVAFRWIAAIVAPFVLFGLGDAWAFTFCHGRPGGETIRGFFVSSKQKTRLHLFARESSDGCRLRHPDLRDHIREAVRQVLSRQRSDGSFGLWGARNREDPGKLGSTARRLRGVVRSAPEAPRPGAGAEAHAGIGLRANSVARSGFGPGDRPAGTARRGR